MLRVARDRIATLFALAEEKAAVDQLPLSDRYVTLARKIGTRYNVRLLPEYRELYCRGCSRFWVEGRTVRTRLRNGKRVRTCLACGRVRRVASHGSHRTHEVPSGRSVGTASEPVPADVSALIGRDLGDESDGSEEE